MSATGNYHKPVLCDEVIDFFLDAPNAVFIDATLGDGGHTEQILKRISDSEVIGIDRDREAIKSASRRLIDFDNRTTFFRGRFGNIEEIVDNHGNPVVGGVLFDLGLRTGQIDDPKRGFSYIKEGPLDMRMDPDIEISAYDLVNGLPRGELTRTIATYGEQPAAGRIARSIDIARRKKPIETTLELAEIVRKSLYGATAADLSRVFQAFRIVVNDELEELSSGLEEALKVLIRGGILIAISYHSLEDRIVKKFIANEEKGCICPPDLPVCRCGHKPNLKRINKKPIRPSEGETVDNPKARSAKLRAARKI